MLWGAFVSPSARARKAAAEASNRDSPTGTAGNVPGKAAHPTKGLGERATLLQEPAFYLNSSGGKTLASQLWSDWREATLHPSPGHQTQVFLSQPLPGTKDPSTLPTQGWCNCAAATVPPCPADAVQALIPLLG